MPFDDRDQQLERALARHLRGASPDADCPDAEILAAYHEQSLSLEGMAHWKTHIASCSRCHETLALLEQTDSIAGNAWEKNELPAALRGAETNAREEIVAAKLAPTAAPVPVVMPSAVNAAAKAHRRVRWSVLVPVGTLAAGLLVWVAVHESPQSARHEKSGVQVAENRELTPPASSTVPEAGKDEARDEGLAAFQSKKPAEHTLTTPALPAKEAPPARMVAPPPPAVPQELAKTEHGKLAQLDASKSANEFRARDAGDTVGGRRSAAAAPATPKPGQAGGPMNSNQVQNQLQNQIANQYSNQVATPSANQPPGQVSEQVTVEAEKRPAAENKKDAEKALKQKNETVTVGAMAETVEVTSAPPAPTAGAISRASLNARETSLFKLQNRSIIVSPDQKHLWRVGSAGKIESSTDAGKTWKSQTSGVAADLLTGSSPSERVCWITGKAGTLLLTRDGGKHWKQVASPIFEESSDILATDAQHATIWGLPHTKSFATTDGGRTWEEVPKY